MHPLIQQIIHYSCHFIVPVFIALLLYPKIWLKAYVVLLLTMVVDFDHVFSTPVYEACRCSIGTHILHSFPAIAIYALMILYRPVRLIAIGLLWHMATDYLDCLLQQFYC